jgi:homocysteine S-methyltransferase
MTTTVRRERSPLPQLTDRVFLTDGGIETTLIYHQGQDLP